MTIKAFRKGETARRWKDDCEREEVTRGTDKIFFTLFIPYKGGSFGFTQVQLQVTSESFAAVAQSMNNADPNAAVRAFVAAGYWELIVQAMMDDNQNVAIRTVGRVLRKNEDAAVGACGTILLDKVGD